MDNCIGIDVSKASINVHISKNSEDLEFVNSVQGFKSLHLKLKKIYKKEIEDNIFIFEPTGSYSETLRKYCYQQKIICFIINPKQFSNYAKALGVEVKNDIEDARVLSKALPLAKSHQIRVPMYDEDVERIKELMSYYKFTTKQTTQQKNHLESLTSKEGDLFSIKELKQSIKESKAKEQRILDQIQMLIDNNPKYKKAYANITSIKGVGQIGGIVLLHLFLKYPEANQRQITSLAGLNPIYKQSGTSVQSGYKISKAGSSMYRGSLFMGVLTAVRFEPTFQTFFNRLIAKGKHTTIAHIAVMRKIIITAHSLYKNDKKFEQNFNYQEAKMTE
ncbi:MAG: IS110 family transposase [Arcobacter sp.]|nr:MAG: IS110 family transposase [Arcobacter sp.]